MTPQQEKKLRNFKKQYLEAKGDGDKEKAKSIKAEWNVLRAKVGLRKLN